MWKRKAWAAKTGGPRCSTGSRSPVESAAFTQPSSRKGGQTTTLQGVACVPMVETAARVALSTAADRRQGPTEDIVRLGIAHTTEGRGTFVELSVEENLARSLREAGKKAGLGQATEGLRVFPGLAPAPPAACGHALGG